MSIEGPVREGPAQGPATSKGQVRPRVGLLPWKIVQQCCTTLHNSVALRVAQRGMGLRQGLGMGLRHGLEDGLGLRHGLEAWGREGWLGLRHGGEGWLWD